MSNVDVHFDVPVCDGIALAIRSWFLQCDREHIRYPAVIVIDVCRVRPPEDPAAIAGSAVIGGNLGGDYSIDLAFMPFSSMYAFEAVARLNGTNGAKAIADVRSYAATHPGQTIVYFMDVGCFRAFAVQRTEPSGD